MSTDQTLSLLHIDEALVAINKPDGIVIHHGLPQEDITLLDLVRDQVEGPIFPTHRLDRATSGVILFARSKAAAAAINGAFSSREVEKGYLALVSAGIDEAGEIDEPLTRSARHHRRSKRPQELLPALTTYRRIAETPRAALCLVAPHTGRQHQIRRHLRSIRHAIWGDKRYGHKRHNRELRIELRLHRLALHAYQLALPHPNGDGLLQLTAPLPPALWRPLEALGFDLDTLGIEKQASAGSHPHS